MRGKGGSFLSIYIISLTGGLGSTSLAIFQGGGEKRERGDDGEGQIEERGNFFIFNINSVQNFITLDPTQPPVLHLKSHNSASLHVRAYSVQAEFNLSQYFDFLEYAKTPERDYPMLTQIWRSDFTVEPPKVFSSTSTFYLSNGKGGGGAAALCC